MSERSTSIAKPSYSSTVTITEVTNLQKEQIVTHDHSTSLSNLSSTKSTSNIDPPRTTPRPQRRAAEFASTKIIAQSPSDCSSLGISEVGSDGEEPLSVRSPPDDERLLEVPPSRFQFYGASPGPAHNLRQTENITNDKNETQVIHTKPGRGLNARRRYQLASTAACDICGASGASGPSAQDIEDDSDTEEYLSQCRCCGSYVHPSCYGEKDACIGSSGDTAFDSALPFDILFENGNFVCQLCLAGVSEDTAECAVCPNRSNRAMKALAPGELTFTSPTTSVCSLSEGQVLPKRWAHVCCALWVPNLYFEDPENKRRIAGLYYIDVQRWDLACLLCAERTQHAREIYQKSLNGLKLAKKRGPASKIPKHFQGSRYRGVIFDTNTETWKATSDNIPGMKRRVVIGEYDNEVKAARAYDAKCYDATGNLNLLNFPDSVQPPDTAMYPSDVLSAMFSSSSTKTASNRGPLSKLWDVKFSNKGNPPSQSAKRPKTTSSRSNSRRSKSRGAGRNTTTSSQKLTKPDSTLDDGCDGLRERISAGFGAPAQCGQGSCTVACHVTCALRAGWEVRVTENTHGDVASRVYCAKHSEHTELTEDETCCLCDGLHDPQTILLCDGCDKGFHMACLTPPLTEIPQGDWFCVKCARQGVTKGTIIMQSPVASQPTVYGESSQYPVATKRWRETSPESNLSLKKHKANARNNEITDDVSAAKPRARRSLLTASDDVIVKNTAMLPDSVEPDKNESYPIDGDGTSLVALNISYLGTLPAPPAFKGATDVRNPTKTENHSLAPSAASTGSNLIRTSVDQEGSQNIIRSIIAPKLCKVGEYFAAHRGKQVPLNCAHSVEELNLPDLHAVQQTLTSEIPKHVQDKALLHFHHAKRFGLYHTYLQSGYNLMFFGFGSKMFLLEQLVKQVAKSNDSILVCNGFNPLFDIEQIVKLIYNKFCGQNIQKNATNDLLGLCHKIAAVLSNKTKEMLRPWRCQKETGAPPIMIDDEGWLRRSGSTQNTCNPNSQINTAIDLLRLKTWTFQDALSEIDDHVITDGSVGVSAETLQREGIRTVNNPLVGDNSCAQDRLGIQLSYLAPKTDTYMTSKRQSDKDVLNRLAHANSLRDISLAVGAATSQGCGNIAGGAVHFEPRDTPLAPINQFDAISPVRTTSARTSKLRSSTYRSKGHASESRTQTETVPPYLYIVLHNLDGEALRSNIISTALNILAGVDRIRFVASVDHVYASMIFDQRQMLAGQWLWLDGTTFAAYHRELVQNVPLVEPQKELSASGVKFVLQSLTPNHREVLQLLAQHQIEHSDSFGMEFEEWFLASVDNLLVNTDTAMRHHLVEFLDHELVATRRTQDEREVWYLPLPPKMVQAIADGEIESAISDEDDSADGT